MGPAESRLPYVDLARAGTDCRHSFLPERIEDRLQLGVHAEPVTGLNLWVSRVVLFRAGV